ncbi:phosphate ABC transporter substrate-binding protein PstS [Gloeobacter kilaueensis]|uniref:Phosphate-binding protein n=1 Tax=Gloeobacter kilaueensis (strain ATCC BAA-2537 / CCAP 1431/1 / ULC 316 / JS1) TaxID=1183438 RepID=U5QFV7_GLOK1|nr:phosphate ABC transporter substrate-binding protein PstS [Gloeobacter kilaueensis]AGY56509.1 phosphate ABC transporter periplasmic phosphate-binding protein [Gloeobacter kilaueensis JS1]
MQTHKWTRRAFGAVIAAAALASPLMTQMALALTLSGAGATFPQPLYEKWFFEYNKKNPDVKISYQGIGSGGGINQFTNKTVDFGASDAAMNDEQLQKAGGAQKVLMLPLTAGAVAVTYNLPGVKSGLKLTRLALVNIFLGKITKWNDPAIASVNRDVKLPDLPVAVVRRSDGSGTTFIFTNHLSAIKGSDWGDKVGKGTSVNWPTGIGAKGNQGISAQVQQTPGAIGYVEYAYATENNLPVAAVENREGKFVLPSVPATKAALDGTKYPENFRVFIEDPDGPASYPIVGLTWLLVYKDNADKSKAAEIGKFVDWALTEGQQYVEPLKYTPLPPALAERVKKAADQIK